MLAIHISTECYPVVKNGGLADVLGSLPKYLVQKNIDNKVIIPFVDNKFTQKEDLITEFKSTFLLGDEIYSYTIFKNNNLAFDLYFVYIPTLLDKPNIYGYENDSIRFLAYQIVILEWLKTWETKIDILHCHDHNSGLIPFFTKYSSDFGTFTKTPVIFTIHGTNYQGIMTWNLLNIFPYFHPIHTQLLTWKGMINSMATGIRCADKVTAVSPNYMNQLCIYSHGLEYIFQTHRYKCSGILNGIDDSIWDPEIDPMIIENYTLSKVEKGKNINKKNICELLHFDDKKPLIVYIGKINIEKGGDILENIIRKAKETRLQSNFIVMGKGNYEVSRNLELLKISFKEEFEFIPYFNESLEHKLFAAADFYLMPSREEPCGLGQMYSLKYGTIPIVSNVGGLDDSVINFEEENGYGIKFSYFSSEDILFSISKAEKVYQDKGLLNALRKRAMSLNFSWSNQADKYINLYNQLTENI